MPKYPKRGILGECSIAVHDDLCDFPAIGMAPRLFFFLASFPRASAEEDLVVQVLKRPTSFFQSTLLRRSLIYSDDDLFVLRNS